MRGGFGEVGGFVLLCVAETTRSLVSSCSIGVIARLRAGFEGAASRSSFTSGLGGTAVVLSTALEARGAVDLDGDCETGASTTAVLDFGARRLGPRARSLVMCCRACPTEGFAGASVTLSAAPPFSSRRLSPSIIREVVCLLFNKCTKLGLNLSANVRLVLDVFAGVLSTR